MKRVLIVPVAVLSTMLAACGGSPTAPVSTSEVKKVDDNAKKVYDEINGLTGEERTTKLVELAEKEGELSLYTSNTDMQALIDAFMDTYDVEVSQYRGNSESVLQRILQESKAGYRGADLIETNSGELNAIAKEGLFYPYEGELRDAVRPEGQKDGWTADRFNAFVIAWNTDKVKDADRPQSLEELADPKWKGQVGLEIGDVDWFQAMWQYYIDQGKTEDEVEAFFRKLASNAKIMKGHTVMAELLQAGQFSVGGSMYSHSVQDGADSGAPVTWQPKSGKPVEPIVIRPNGAGLLGNASHPAAAMLFMDFLLTDGQKEIAAQNRIGSVPGGDDPLAGLTTVSPDEDELLDNSEKWNDLYADIVENGEKAE